jgi:hypothetical protein
LSLSKPIKTHGFNIFIRDTITLASAASRSLEALGRVHGVSKISLDRSEIIDMERLCKTNFDKFKEYAMIDSLIPLIHGLFVEQFRIIDTFKTGIPNTLAGLSRDFLKKY